MMSAQDETYRDAKNIHSKWMRHQAFEAEVKSNKDRLDKLVDEGQEIIKEKPDMASVSLPCYHHTPPTLSSSLRYVSEAGGVTILSMRPQLSLFLAGVCGILSMGVFNL